MGEEESSRLKLFVSGSFDPITNYHIRIIELVKHYFTVKGCREPTVVLSLTPKTSNTNSQCTDTADRLKMCHLATSNDPTIIIDDWECKQRCYTVLPRVLEHLTSTYCNDGDTVGVLVSEEQFTQFTHWHQDQVDDLMRDKNVISVSSHPHKLLKVAQYCPKFSTYEENMHVVIDHAETCKPNVRQAAACNQTIEGLVCPSVQKYILEHHIYWEEEADTESTSNLGLQVSPVAKNRIRLPDINSRVAETAENASKSPKMTDFLRVKKVRRTLPSIDRAYAELLDRRKDFWPSIWHTNGSGS